MFDIILGGVDDHEVGSASGILQSLQQLGTCIGIAGVGTLFFSLLGSNASRKLGFLHAGHQTILVTIGLIVVAAGLAALLPRHARMDEGPGSAVEPSNLEAEPALV